MERIIVKIEKIKEIEDSITTENLPVGIPIDLKILKTGFHPPKIGEYFFLGIFRTDKVQKILSEDTFQTLNSVYKWTIMK